MVVDVGIQYLVTYLTQERVIELEDAHLHTVSPFGMGSNPFPQSLMVHRLLQLMQDLIGACHDARRHS